MLCKKKNPVFQWTALVFEYCSAIYAYISQIFSSLQVFWLKYLYMLLFCAMYSTKLRLI